MEDKAIVEQILLDQSRELARNLSPDEDHEPWGGPFSARKETHAAGKVGNC